MHLRTIFAAGLLASMMAISSIAAAADPQAFVQQEQQHVEQLLRQPASADRDAKISHVLSAVFDYDQMTERCFNKHWTELSPDQQTEVKGLLRQLIEKNYKRNLMKTLDYDVTYKGTRDLGDESRIRTEAKSKANPREPVVRVDYVVKPDGDKYRVIDVVTEGSSLTKNYYSQFHRMLTTPGQGYPYIVSKLKEKLAKHD